MQNTVDERMRLAFEAQRAAFRSEPYPSLATRLDRIERVRAMTTRYSEPLVAAVSADFEHRARQETELTDLFTVQSGARHAQRHLRGWMRERRVPTALHFLPASNRLLPQPLGVVGILSPWNYPYYLAMAPAVAALAAGNRVLLKPSELTPETSSVIARMVAEYFRPDEMDVVLGDASVGRAFSSLPFDHLFFTGSTAVGREVAKAAAANLTPVTLELGGKSPAIVHPSANLARTAERLAFGKLLNAGQTCVAPDYVLVPRPQQEALATALKQAMRRLYPSLDGNPDYTAMVSERHRDRLRAIITEAEQQGARIIATHDEVPAGRKFVPRLLLDVKPDMRVMREEIFGPLLPLVPYDQESDAYAFVRERDRPLALYWFGEDRAAESRALRETHAGGVTTNDCIWHLGQEEQPFGGVGASGIGAYHGEWGFRTFSKEKPVFRQSRFAGTALFYPPYGKTFERLLAALRRIAG